MYGKVSQYCESLEQTTITVFGLSTDSVRLIVTPNYKFQRNSVTLVMPTQINTYRDQHSIVYYLSD